MDKVELLDRTRKFAIKVFKLVNQLPKSKATDVVSYQLLKSASSVAANYRAVNRAKSKADFGNKLSIVLEEADESNFWLTFISDVGLLKKDNEELNFLIKESEEFIAIFTASVKTINNSKNQKS
jgi:four helix bundle protein